MKSIKLWSIIILLHVSIFALAQDHIAVINNQNFNFVCKDIDDFGAYGIELYRGKVKILSHTLSKTTRDCSSESYELGTYSVLGNKIIFYTYWATADRTGKEIYPFGFRKQTYQVNNKGRLILISSELYIEDFDISPGHPTSVDKQIALLAKAKKNASVRPQLQQYIDDMEQKYNALFVWDNKKDILETEVRNILQYKIEKYTKDWNISYGKNCKY